jgi:hypothetical protein
LRDAREHVETPRTTFRESRPSKKFPNYMALMSSILDPKPSFYIPSNILDYEDTFASIARYNSIRAVISFVSFMGWKIHQMDVKTAFLNGIIEKEVYMEQTQGFEVGGKESHVCFAVNTLSQFMVELRQEH